MFTCGFIMGKYTYDHQCTSVLTVRKYIYVYKHKCSYICSYMYVIKAHEYIYT